MYLWRTLPVIFDYLPLFEDLSLKFNVDELRELHERTYVYMKKERNRVNNRKEQNQTSVLKFYNLLFLLYLCFY